MAPISLWFLDDHLLHDHPGFPLLDKNRDYLLFIESHERAARLPYHKQRLALILASLRQFANSLRIEGWNVAYFPLSQTPSDANALQLHLQSTNSSKILLLSPNNYWETQHVSQLARQFPIHLLPNHTFLLSRDEFTSWASSRSRLLMEHHYRRLRTKFQILLDPDGSPSGGQWNYDHLNRATHADWLRDGCPLPPPPPSFPTDPITQSALDDVQRLFPYNPGSLLPFRWPVTRHQWLLWLDDFLANRLPLFGKYQDLMLSHHPHLFHSLLSPGLNLGLLRPLECIHAALDALAKNLAPLTAVEGFIRQILGWREFIHGIYWTFMPNYTSSNSLNAHRPLPAFFWNANTPLHCLHCALRDLLHSGFNHHIQRLMLLGNFCLLASISPSQTLDWFNAMFIDAHDWVMAGNVLGMALHADGGLLATKPYAAGAAYIHRMSNYCPDCYFSPTDRTGPRSCPLQHLYWHFFDLHASRFANNPRTSLTVRSWLAKPPAARHQSLQLAADFLQSLESSDTPPPPSSPTQLPLFPPP